MAGRRSRAGPTAGAPKREPDTTHTDERREAAAWLVASSGGSPSRGVVRDIPVYLKV